MDKIRKAKMSLMLITATPPALTVMLLLIKVTVFKNLSWWIVTFPIWIVVLVLILAAVLIACLSLRSDIRSRRKICLHCVHASPAIAGQGDKRVCMHYAHTKGIRPEDKACPDFYGSITRGYKGK